MEGKREGPFAKKEATNTGYLSLRPNAVLDDRAPVFCTLVRPQQVPGALTKNASKMPAEMRLVVKTRFGRDVC
jgi:hypothetical protein